MSNFKDRLISYKKLFEGEYKNVIDEYVQSAENNSSDTFRLLISEVSRVGLLKKAKRLRPILVFIGYELLSGKSIDSIKNEEVYHDIMNSAIALELFHTSALIYDDIIDEGMERRGEKTIEAFYRGYFKNGDVKHHATSAAILAGNLAFSLADRTMNKVKNSRVRELYYKMQFEIIDGQTDDCFGVGFAKLEDLSESKIIDMMKAKSGSYSITNPLTTGILLADNRSQEKESIEVIKSVGFNLGIIFQLSDDLLGIYGDNTGKSNTSDITEGKKTLIMFNTYNQSTDEEKSKINSILGNLEASDDEINWLKKHIKDKEVDQGLKLFCYGLNEKVKIKLNNQFEPSQPLEFLLEMSQYLVEREV